MRRARVSFPGSLHHVMSRGYQGEPIFSDSEDKDYLLSCWRKFSARHSISILAWCILDNHFHLVLHNPEDTLSRFMREANGSYGIYYRQIRGGRGTVFDGRFRSTVIENEEYLQASILYLFQNPVRAGLADSPERYRWSSIHELLGDDMTGLVDLDAFAAIAGEPGSFCGQLKMLQDKPVVFPDRWGESQGSQVHRFHALRSSNRRKTADPQSSDEQRLQDRKRSGSRAAIAKFLLDNDITMKTLTGRSHSSAALRRKLLVILRDECGLRFKEIHKLEPFRRLRLNSLGGIYHSEFCEKCRK